VGRAALRSGVVGGYTERMNTRLVLSIVLMSLLLAGCGNKGPLIQAPREAAEVPASDGTPPAHDESEPADAAESEPEDGSQPPVVDPSIEPVPSSDDP
jgi:predicted small lipoprotein YifL